MSVVFSPWNISDQITISSDIFTVFAVFFFSSSFSKCSSAAGTGGAPVSKKLQNTFQTLPQIHYEQLTPPSATTGWVAHVPVCLPPAVWTFYLHVRTESLQGWLLFPITKAIFQNFISLTAHLRSSYLLYLHTEKNDSDQGILNWRDITCSLPALTTSALLCHAFHVAMGDQEKPNAPAEVYLLQGLCFHQIKHTHCTNVIKAGSQTQVIKQQQQKTLKPFKPDSVKPEHKGEWPEGRCTYCEDIIVANLSLVVKRWRGSSRP